MSVVSSKADHKELLIKLLDYQYSTEMLDIANWGIEGVTYNIVNGQKEFIPEIRNAAAPRAAAEPYGIITSATNFLGIRAPKERQAWSNIFASFPAYANGEYFDYDDIWKFTDEYEGGKDSVFPDEIAPPVNLTQDELDIRSNIFTPLETEIHEAVMGFISGTKSLDTYDAWVASLSSIGDYEALKAIYNAKYSQYK
jgi:putative aldouronate transport system substrate-binding protein